MKLKSMDHVKVFGLARCVQKLDELFDENKEVWLEFCELFNAVFKTDQSVFKDIANRKIILYSYRNNSSAIKKSFLYLAEYYGFKSRLIIIGYKLCSITLDRKEIEGLPKIRANEFILNNIENFKQQWEQKII